MDEQPVRVTTVDELADLLADGGAAPAEPLPKGRGWGLGLDPPLGMDLLLQSNEDAPADASFEQRFVLHAPNPAFAARRLAPLVPLLVGLAQRHGVVLRDDSLLLFPQVRVTPRELAADFMRFVEASQALARARPEPSGGDSAAFCYFCGQVVAPGTAACPACGEGLDPDGD